MNTPLPERRRLGHAIPGFVRAEEAIFFITVCCQPRKQNHLCIPDLAKRIFDSVAFLHQRGDWHAYYVLLMPDHLHALMSFPAKEMKPVIEQWKKFTGRMLKIPWQRGFEDHRLRNDESLREKEDYVGNNPVRAGLASSRDEWPYVWRPPAG